jgi:hypothetical protein
LYAIIKYAIGYLKHPKDCEKSSLYPIPYFTSFLEAELYKDVVFNDVM